MFHDKNETHESSEETGSSKRSSLSSKSEVSLQLSYHEYNLQVKREREKRLIWTQTKWSTKYQYLLTSICTCVSVSGGLTLTVKANEPDEPCIVQYTFCLLVIIIPVLYSQVFIGQYSQLGVSFFKQMAPVAHGIGYCFITQSLVGVAVEGMLMAYAALLLLCCFRSNLEWMRCPSDQNSTTCWDGSREMCIGDCIQPGIDISAQIFIHQVFLRQFGNSTAENAAKATSRAVAQPIMIVICWIILCIIADRGMNSYVKMIKIFTFMSLVFMSLLIIVCLLTSGATLGISYMILIPKGALYNFKSWSWAIHDSCSVLILSQLYHVTYGTYMNPNMEANTLIVIVAILVYTLTLLNTALMYAASGIIVHRAKSRFSKVSFLWTGHYSFLSEFSIVPQGLGFLGAPQLWSAIYFALFTLLLLNGLVTKIDVIEKSISETHQNIRGYRLYILAGISIVCCILSVFLSFADNFVLLEQLDRRILPSTRSLVLWLFTIMVYWVYKVPRIADDIHFLTGKQPTQYFKACWYVIPILCAMPFIQITFFEDRNERFSTQDYILGILIVCPLPILFIYNLFKYLKAHNLLSIIQPQERWGPPDPRERQLRRMFNPREETKIRRRNETCKHTCLWKSKILNKAVLAEETYEEVDENVLESELSSLDEDWNET